MGGCLVDMLILAHPRLQSKRRQLPSWRVRMPALAGRIRSSETERRERFPAP